MQAQVHALEAEEVEAWSALNPFSLSPTSNPPAPTHSTLVKPPLPAFPFYPYLKPCFQAFLVQRTNQDPCFLLLLLPF